MKFLIFFLILVFTLSGCLEQSEIFIVSRPKLNYSSAERFPSTMPPGGLNPQAVPQFVIFGFDDNGLSGLKGSKASGGLDYLIKLFDQYENPEGAANAGTFDGTDSHFSFYVNGMYIGDPQYDDYGKNKLAWQKAVLAGHEIGNHSYSHQHGGAFTQEEWYREIIRTNEQLIKPLESDGIGLPAENIYGFRTPFLEYNDFTFSAVKQADLIYDCSIEEGYQNAANGRNFYWPYTLDTAGEGKFAFPEWWFNFKAKLKPHPGLWEIPCYVFIVPPDELCENYGVDRGLRERLKERQAYFDVQDGKIAGVDWNLFVEFNMTKEEALAVLKYSYDLRLRGNRAPFTVVGHSELYTDQYNKWYLGEEAPNYQTTGADRRWTLEALLEYVSQKPETRIVSAIELLDWLNDPSPLILDPSVDVYGPIASYDCSMTFYWTYDSEKEGWEEEETSRPFMGEDGQPLFDGELFNTGLIKQAVLEGSAFIQRANGETVLINLLTDDDSNPRFMVLDPSQYQWGLDANGNPLQLFKTIAVDPEIIPGGAVVYIKEFDGLKLPDGTIHDGKFFADDTGWSFSGQHIDVSAGTYDWYDIVVYQVPYNVTVELIEY